MNTSVDTPLEGLLKNGVVHIPVTSSFVQLTKDLDVAWAEFVSQDKQHKDLHVFANGMGYEYRGVNARDYKETFHVKAGYKLPRKHSTIDLLFIETAKSILIDSVPLVADFAESLSEIAGRDMRAFVTAHTDQWLSRSLNYPPRTEEQVNAGENVLALRHIDKGLTFHIAETDPGLMVLWNGEWIPVEHTEGFIHGYGGMLTQYYTKGAVKALCHEVLTNPVTQLKGRRSHVLFIDFGNAHYNKSKYGPTQDNFPCGENYNMPPEEFNSYFIET